MTDIRCLAAILAVDAAGYSRLIGADEGGTLQTSKTIREEAFDPKDRCASGPAGQDDG
jgi:adenylate cyclase